MFVAERGKVVVLCGSGAGCHSRAGSDTATLVGVVGGHYLEGVVLWWWLFDFRGGCVCRLDGHLVVIFITQLSVISLYLVDFYHVSVDCFYFGRVWCFVAVVSALPPHGGTSFVVWSVGGTTRRDLSAYVFILPLPCLFDFDRSITFDSRWRVSVYGLWAIFWPGLMSSLVVWKLMGLFKNVIRS
ncbi:hypothetical protein L195_g007181 [Trifolium pratense]|uniref:Transmembrane protein n=1 Tax=Trifolium pratense TaxID=57577 RepID=A0A2K3P5P2_TRIPR|nr:hypothetical protein L195_g044331 [Trifolium pratense]PNX88431.1 hypothetical protein L195_g044536 [Trifolium pratense]PNX89038.1 hypothetical protein L195_g045155 [Trifolium pratense]PNY10599.1 hypothetical protein L195_g007181 [Trifolium pratense]